MLAGDYRQVEHPHPALRAVAYDHANGVYQGKGLPVDSSFRVSPAVNQGTVALLDHAYEVGKSYNKLA